MKMESIGNKIRQFRKRAALSQFDLELDIDAAAGSISRIENGLVNPTKETLKKIAKVLDLSGAEEALLFEIELQSLLNNKNSYQMFFPNPLDSEKWLLGDLKGLQNLLNNRYELLNINELVGLAFLNLELGEANKSQQIVNHIKKIYNTDVLNLSGVGHYINIIEAELDIINDEYQLATSKINAIISSGINDSFLLGKSYYLLGLISSQYKDSKNGLLNMSKALEYFDILRYPIELGKTYLYMTDFLEFSEDYETAQEYYIRAESIFDDLGNNYLIGWCTGGKAFNKYIQGDVSDALQLSRKAMRIDQRSGSTKQLYYSTSVFAKSLIVSGDYEEAYSTYDESMRLEKNFRKQLQTSTNNLYKLFIKSKTNDIYITELENIVLNQTPKDITKQYLLYTAQYLFSKEDSIKKAGELKLRDLQRKSNYMHFKRAIDNTLIDKRIQPIAT